MTIVFISYLAGVYFRVPFTLSFAAELITHWVITFTYLSVAFDARMIVNVETYLDNPDKMAQVDRQRTGMFIANIVMLLLIAAYTVCWFFEGLEE